MFQRCQRRLRKKPIGRLSGLIVVLGLVLCGVVGGTVVTVVLLLRDRKPVAKVLEPVTGKDGDRKGGSSELREAEAEADRLDPGWRLKDLEAKRKVYPPEENAAICVMAAAQQLPPGWPAPAPGKALERYPVNKALRADLDRWMTDQGDEGMKTERALPDPRPKKKDKQ